MVDKLSENLSERAEALLRSLVQLYIDGGSPVGSRTLAREAGLEVSPATVRNVMSDLEELGYIASPHTSSGRIPTQAGYRFFVDSMLRVEPLNNDAFGQLEHEFEGRADPQQLLERATNLVSQVTSFAGIVTVPRDQDVRFRQIEFLDLSENRVLAILVTEDGRVQNRVIAVERKFSPSELVEAANFFNHKYRGRSLAEVRHVLLTEMARDNEQMGTAVRTAASVARGLFDDDEEGAENADVGDVVLSGEQNLLDVPDLAELDTLRDLFTAFKAKHDLLELLDKSLKADGVSIYIGEESGYKGLNNVSVVTAPYTVDGNCLGVLGVIGPTRMAYSEVIPIVDATARLLGSALSLTGDSHSLLTGE